MYDEELDYFAEDDDFYWDEPEWEQQEYEEYLMKTCTQDGYNLGVADTCAKYRKRIGISAAAIGAVFAICRIPCVRKHINSVKDKISEKWEDITSKKKVADTENSQPVKITTEEEIEESKGDLEDEQI